MVELSRDRGTKFVGKIIKEIEHEIDDYLTEFPEDKQIEEFWEPIKNKMLSVPYTKRRLRDLRRIWRAYKKEKDWKKLMRNLNDFLWEKGIRKKEPVGPFNKNLLKLVVIDLIS